VATTIGGLVNVASERTPTTKGLRGLHVQSGRLSTEFLFTRFAAQVRACLHIILCVDPTEDTFKDQIRKYPSINEMINIDLT
jgi:P-loop containing dynein motor region D4